MRGLGWRVPGLLRGDWRSNLVAVAQIAIGVGALVGYVSMVTLHPFWLLAFTLVQGLILVGVVLFAIVVIFAQRALIEEEFEAGETIFEEGEEGKHVYVIKSGTVEVLRKSAEGTPEMIAQLGPGNHFGEMALLGKAPRNATTRAATAVEVLKMDRSSFAALYTMLPGVRQEFSQAMESRLKELRGLKRRRRTPAG
jgi:hypothetical protein